jgi:hypothetical protein
MLSCPVPTPVQRPVTIHHHQNSLLERAHRFRLFVEEVGGTLPSAVAAPAVMRTVLRKLWRLPLPNTLKQTYWYCFLNGMPKFIN